MAKTPYQIYDEQFLASVAQINARRQVAENDKIMRERQLYDKKTEFNRGLAISLGNATNPFSANAEKRSGMGSGVSDYYKNQAYATWMQGVGQSESDYQSNKIAADSEYNSQMLDYADMELQEKGKKDENYLTQGERDRAFAESQRQFNEQQRLEELKLASRGGGGSGNDGLYDLTGKEEEETAKTLKGGWTGAGQIYTETGQPYVPKLQQGITNLRTGKAPVKTPTSQSKPQSYSQQMLYNSYKKARL